MQQAGHLHFLTFSCDRRSPKLGSVSSRVLFCEALEGMRLRWRLRVVGYAVMPEHVHLLLSEPATGSLGLAVQMLKQTVSRRAGVRGERFWNPRYYDFNVWSAEKIEEKLAYMHLNPVRRGLCGTPTEWRWSSAGFYAGGAMGSVVVEPYAWVERANEVGVL